MSQTTRQALCDKLGHAATTELFLLSDDPEALVEQLSTAEGPYDNGAIVSLAVAEQTPWESESEDRLLQESALFPAHQHVEIEDKGVLRIAVLEASDPFVGAKIASSIVLRAAPPLMQAVWVPSARHFVDPKWFRRMERMAGDGLATLAWVNLCSDWSKESSVKLSTTGLELFGHREIEVLVSSLMVGELRSLVQELATHLVETGEAFDDGTPLGGVGGTQEMRVVHRPSVANPGRMVYRIVED